MKFAGDALITFICCTWKEDKDFGSFVILLPTVSVFTVHRITGVLPCVSTCGVDYCQDAISLTLDYPAEPKQEWNIATIAILCRICLCIE